MINVETKLLERETSLWWNYVKTLQQPYCRTERPSVITGGLKIHTTIPVISPASNLEMASSRDFCMLLLIRWQINLFKSMLLPSNCTCLCRSNVIYRLGGGPIVGYFKKSINQFSKNTLKPRYSEQIFQTLFVHHIE